MLKSNIPLDEVLLNYFLKPVKIKLTTWKDFDLKAYLIGVKLPVNEMVMLYYVKVQHIEKYLKHKNPRWVEVLPYDLLDKINELPIEQEVDDLLHITVMKQDITYQE